MSSSKKEAAFNAVEWMKTFKQARERGAIPKDTGAILIYFNLDNPAETAVCVGSINHAGIIAACKGILKKLSKDPDSRIIKPEDFQ